MNVIKPQKSKSFMSENSTPNNVEKDDYNLNNEMSNYNNLIKKLKEIKTTIVLLEKKILK